MRRKEGDKSNEILNAAVSIFAREGYDKAQVSAIAASAGVGTGSIYLYFSGKDDILRRLFARFWECLATEMAMINHPDPRIKMNELLGLFFDRLIENREFARVYLREHHRFLETSEPKFLEPHRRCLEIGENVFREIPSSAPRQILTSNELSLRLSQAFLFGGVRSALEFGLSENLDTQSVRSHMLTMAMASIVAAT